MKQKRKYILSADIQKKRQNEIRFDVVTKPKKNTPIPGTSLYKKVQNLTPSIIIAHLDEILTE